MSNATPTLLARPSDLHIGPTLGSRVMRAPAGARGCGASAVARTVEAGLIVHVAHPNFPGVVMTAGLSRRADGSSVYEMIAHGATSRVAGDLDSEFATALELGRCLTFQVGNRRAFWAAQAKLESVVSK